MENVKEKIEALAAVIQEQRKRTLDAGTRRGTNPQFLDENPEFNKPYYETHIRPGKKYTKIDVGQSGFIMVVNETGEIFGIKGYGKINKRKFYGTVENSKTFFWGEFRPYKVA